MSDTSKIRRGLRMMIRGLEELLAEYRRGDPLPPDQVEAMRSKLAAHENDMDVVRRGAPDMFAKLRPELEVVAKLKAEVVAAMGEAP